MSPLNMKLSQFRCLFPFQKGATCLYVSNNTHTSKLVGNLSSDHNKYVHQIILMEVVVKVNERVKFCDIFCYTFSFLSVLEMATDFTLTELQYNVFVLCCQDMQYTAQNLISIKIWFLFLGYPGDGIPKILSQICSTTIAL